MVTASSSKTKPQKRYRVIREALRRLRGRLRPTSRRLRETESSDQLAWWSELPWRSDESKWH